MNKRVGLLGVLAMAAVGLFHPAAASAQDRGYYGRDGYRGGEYAQRYQDGREWRNDERFREHEWREARERQEWRERQWREQERCDRWGRPYGYGYRAPAIGFGLRFYGR